MHGTGELFDAFMRCMPEPKHLEGMYYPADVRLSYSKLLRGVQAFVPSEEPYFLLAESFSAPLAIQFAATKPINLKGLILAAGFASSPLRGVVRWAAWLLAPLAFRLPIPSIALRRLLIGEVASSALEADVRAAISSVRADVLTARLHAVLGCDVRRQLECVEVPILFLEAMRDRLISRRCMEEMRRIRPDAEVAEIDGPHLILQREPGRAAVAVERFMRRVG
jgi:pimeloyl-ACP methyl ester carboxylesterase